MSDMQVGGVDRQEAEFALDTLMRASAISGDKKMMHAVGEVARERKLVLENFSTDNVPRSMHKDATRKGRIDF